MSKYLPYTINNLRVINNVDRIKYKLDYISPSVIKLHILISIFIKEPLFKEVCKLFNMPILLDELKITNNYIYTYTCNIAQIYKINIDFIKSFNIPYSLPYLIMKQLNI